MPPNLRQKLQFHAQAVPRVLATAKATNISFFALFLADTGSVFGNRQDQDRYETFLRLSENSAVAPYLAETVLFSSSMFLSNGNVPRGIRFPIVIKPIWGAQSVGVVGIRDENTLRHFFRKRRRPYIAQHFIRIPKKLVCPSRAIQQGQRIFLALLRSYLLLRTKNGRMGSTKFPNTSIIRI